jgi:inner membrane transporter RhtA
VASVVAAGLITPLALVGHGSELDQVHILLLGATVGVLSSVIPYACELVALRSLRPSTFGVLMSLEPAAATLAGFVVVGEVLAAPQLLAIGCVVAASIGATRTGAARIAEPVPD